MSAATTSADRISAATDQAAQLRRRDQRHVVEDERHLDEGGARADVDEADRVRLVLRRLEVERVVADVTAGVEMAGRQAHPTAAGIEGRERTGPVPLREQDAALVVYPDHGPERVRRRLVRTGCHHVE